MFGRKKQVTSIVTPEPRLMWGVAWSQVYDGGKIEADICIRLEDGNNSRTWNQRVTIPKEVPSEQFLEFLENKATSIIKIEFNRATVIHNIMKRGYMEFKNETLMGYLL